MRFSQKLLRADIFSGGKKGFIMVLGQKKMSGNTKIIDFSVGISNLRLFILLFEAFGSLIGG